MNTLMINGHWLTGEGEWLVSRNPADNRVLWKKRAADDSQAALAVEAARAAQPGWAQRPLMERVACLRRFAELLRQHQKSLAHVIELETGKASTECVAEVDAMVNKVRISLEAFQTRTGEWRHGEQALQHRPLGVVLVLGPFNFPGHLPNGQIVPALLAGNTVVFKPSEETPWVAEQTALLWQAAGLPKGVFNLIQGDSEVGEALCQQPIDGVFFTGSSTAGMQLHLQLAGRPEVLLAMEMGGNNPLIVDRNVPVDQAVELIVQSAFATSGQRCTCARRLILLDDGHHTQALLKALVEASRRLTLRPLINMAARNRLLGAQAHLRSLGGHTLLPMHTGGGHSSTLSPGLLDMTVPYQRGDEIPDEEWFGPLLQVYRVADMKAALALANATRFGLAAGLISQDALAQQRFRQEIRAGVVSINTPTAGASSELPFGGVGASGNHRAGAWYTADYCAWPQATRFGTTPRFGTTLGRRIRQAG